MVLLDILRWWWRLLAVWVCWWRSACPLVRAGQAVWLLLLVLRMLSHVRSRLLGWRRRESRVHVWRLGIRAICGLLRGGRLPVGWELALATLVREHGRTLELGGRGPN